MAEQRFVAGSMGPWLYNDADEYPSQYGSFEGETMESFITTGQGRVMGTPTHEEHVIRLKDFSSVVPLNKVQPDSLSVVTGSLASGTVDDTKVWNDGNNIAVDEAASTPGYDVQFTFENVTDIKEIATSVHYSGTSTHRVELQIYNYIDTAWETVTQIVTGLGYSLVSVNFPADSDDYISSSQSKIRFYHVSAGNASHDLYVNYIGILQ